MEPLHLEPFRVLVNPRLALLLRHLNQRSFKEPPSGVGLKTMIDAQDRGLIEFDMHLKPLRARLTFKGGVARHYL
jgi:hypothetical protein